MSSYSPIDYASQTGASWSRHDQRGERLPPLRSVLGNELDLVARSGALRTHSRQNSYDLAEMSRALPPTARRHGAPIVSHTHDTRSSYSSHHESQPLYPSSTLPNAYGRIHTHDPEATAHWRRGAQPRTDRSPHRKFVCTWPGCEKRFERQNALDTHMNIHTDSKPFMCPVPTCGKAFNVLSNMRRHAANHKEHDAEETNSHDNYENSHRRHSSGEYTYPSGHCNNRRI